jgi:hypothetical protein
MMIILADTLERLHGWADMLLSKGKHLACLNRNQGDAVPAEAEAINFRKQNGDKGTQTALEHVAYSSTRLEIFRREM